MAESITTTQMLKALESMCDTIENEKEYLSELDGAIGDGDHGVNMAKCFREVRKKLTESSAGDIGTPPAPPRGAAFDGDDGSR